MRKPRLLLLAIAAMMSVATMAQKNIASYLIAFEAKGAVRSIVSNDGAIKLTAQFNPMGQLVNLYDQYGALPFSLDNDGFSITGRDPESQHFIVNASKRRIDVVERTSGECNYRDKYIYSPNGQLTQIQRTTIEGFNETGTKTIKVTEQRDSHGNWISRTIGDDNITRSIIYYDANTVSGADRDTANDYVSWFRQFNRYHKVSGGAGIEQFCRAIDIYDPEDFSRNILDKKNGYYSVNKEGAGHFICNAALWNRKDGRKLFIVSYDFAEAIYPSADKVEHGNMWYYTCVTKDPYEDNAMRYEMGVMAFLYDAQQQVLVPLREPPFSNWPTKAAFRYLEVPRQGKDITVRTGQEWQQPTTRTMKWNGMTFTY